MHNIAHMVSGLAPSTALVERGPARLLRIGQGLVELPPAVRAAARYLSMAALVGLFLTRPGALTGSHDFLDCGLARKSRMAVFLCFSQLRDH
jgi:hypothetical protein